MSKHRPYGDQANRQRGGWSGWRFLLWLPVYYLLAVAAAYFLQDFLLYHPSRFDRESLESRAQRNGLVLWPPGAEDYRGLTSPLQTTATRGTAVVFHGNAGSAEGRTYYLAALERLGYRVLLAEYPGYGARPGTPSEGTFFSDAEATVMLAAEHWDEPIYLIGESMGCAVVAGVAARGDAPVSGLLLITPWDSLPSLAQSLFWYLPARWLVRDRFDSVRNLAGYSGPVAVAMAERDEVIPVKHTQNLYTSLSASKRLWVFPGAGHNSWPIAATEPWWTEAMEFLTAAHPR